MFFVGIDPGASGGIAVLDASGDPQAVTKMLDTERDLWEWLSRYHEARLAVIEKVHSMPKQGVASSFAFGRSYGFLRGVLISCGFRFEEVEPAVWQAHFVPRKPKAQKPKDDSAEARKAAVAAAAKLKREHKTALRGKAQQLWPNLKITHAIADALLIAEHARRIWKNTS